MTKSELILTIKKLYPVLKGQQIKQLIDLVFSTLSKGIQQGKRIEIRGFGSFSLKKRKVQANFPYPNQDMITLNDKHIVYFRMGKDFFKKLNPSNEY